MEDLLLTDIISDPGKACLGGLVVGIAFGALAQASRFCLRSACIEFWEGRLGQKVRCGFSFSAARLPWSSSCS